jgi:hypothetical protein
MARPPRLHPGNVLRAAEVVLVLGLGELARLLAALLAALQTGAEQ